MKVRRTQPPVGYRVALGMLGRAAVGRMSARAASPTLERQLAGYFDVRDAHTVTSGKAALTVVLKALYAMTGRTRVILPAYTCYSVPSAIVKAGLVPVPCDIADDSFDYDYDQLAELVGADVLCALSVHLFGIPSDTSRLLSVCRPRGVFVVEDAAQAMGASADGELLGTRGDAGIFSLGRGKNLTCGSGGIILTRSSDIADTLRPMVEALPEPNRVDEVRAIGTLLAQSVFISPWLYWLPAGVPALKLGETLFEEEFGIGRLSEVQARLLHGWPERLAALNERRKDAGAFYLRHIDQAKPYGREIPYLRFPLMVRPDGREHLLRKGRSMGISRMYPATVAAIPQLANLMSRRCYPRAERMAKSLITLPTHPLITAADRMRIAALVNIGTFTHTSPARMPPIES